jgi:transposase InsO family protein
VISAESVAEAFYSGWVSRFGAPETIVTDQGRQFESELFHSFSKLLGTEKLRTTAYNPSSNGMVERLHRQLKAAIKCKDSENWVASLPSVLLGIRCAIKDDLGAY